jgi:hypothetical protein
VAAQSTQTGAVLAAGTAEVAVLAASTIQSMATVLPYEEAIACASRPAWARSWLTAPIFDMMFRKCFGPTFRHDPTQRLQ